MNVFSEIEVAHFGISGWCSWKKAETLASIIIALRPKITVEVGVWFGKSAIPMAMAHRHIGHGALIAVDPWLAGCSVEGQTNQADVDWWRNQSAHEQALQSFRNTIGHFQLQNQVQIQRMDSSEFNAPDGIGLAHIDGNHGAKAISDVEKICPKIIAGGYAVLDDLGWSTGSVKIAVEKVKAMGFKELYIVDDKDNQWGVFQKL